MNRIKIQIKELIDTGIELVKEAWEENPLLVIAGGITILAVLISILVMIAQPGFEAATFNKLTGGHASYWDAIWVQLRVDCSNIQ